MTKVILQKAESLVRIRHVAEHDLRFGCNLPLRVSARDSTFKSLGVRDPDVTQCVIGPHRYTSQMASKFTERFKQGARM